MRKFGIRDCGGALRRLTLATGLLTACALWMDEPAYAACTPASASGVTVSCTGTTTNQGGGAPGTSGPSTIGYGTGTESGITINIGAGSTLTGSSIGITIHDGTVINGSGSTISGPNNAIVAVGNLSLTNEFAPACAFLAGLGNPDTVTAVPGNHDSYVRSAETLAVQYWADYMRGDNNENFPFVRRRGSITIVGLSTSLPTAPLAATGRLHGDQLPRLREILATLGRENAFRVVLIHHPPTEGAHHFRRLRDAAEMRDVLKQCGAELVLHGHHHEASLAWLPGPQQRVPVIGVPSASGSPDFHYDPAGYNLYEIDGEPGAWRCTMVSRGWDRKDGRITELRRQPLMG